MDPASIAAIVTALSTMASSFAGKGKTQRETPTQKNQRKMIDELRAGMKGEGQYADYFNPSYEAFQKSYVDPAKKLWGEQIAPQVMQGLDSTGFGRSTSFDDALTRSGVDMDMMLNQQWAGMQDAAYNRQGNAINSILGANQGIGPQSQQGPAEMGITSLLGNQDFMSQLMKIFGGEPDQGGTTATSGGQRTGFYDTPQYQMGRDEYGNQSLRSA